MNGVKPGAVIVCKGSSKGNDFPVADPSNMDTTSCALKGAFKLIKLAFKPSFKPLKVVASMLSKLNWFEGASNLTSNHLHTSLQTNFKPNKHIKNTCFNRCYVGGVIEYRVLYLLRNASFIYSIS